MIRRILQAQREALEWHDMLARMSGDDPRFEPSLVAYEAALERRNRLERARQR